MANLLTSIVKYFLLILIAYCAFSIVFSNRVDTSYFSVVLSDGWTVSKPVAVDEDGTLTSTFYNKRTQTYVAVTVMQKGLGTDIYNLTSSILDFGSSILNPDIERSEFKIGNGFEYSNFKEGDVKGVVFKTSNETTQAMVNIYGTSYGDGVDFVNTFFKDDPKLFPELNDPTLPPNNFNYVLMLRKFKTWIHSSLNPTEWFS